MRSAMKVAERIVMLYPLARLDDEEPQVIFRCDTTLEFDPENFSRFDLTSDEVALPGWFPPGGGLRFADAGLVGLRVETGDVVRRGELLIGLDS